MKKNTFNKTLLAVCIASTTAYVNAASTTRIINGSLTKSGSYPWMVSLQSKDGQHFCGASMITDQWVMTAAHCVEQEQAGNVQVVAGEFNLTDSNDGGQTRQVTKIIVHPQRGGNDDNDIALLKLNSAVKGVAVTRATPAVMKNIAIGTKLTVMGWGNQSVSGESFPEKLYEVQVPLVSNIECNKSYNGDITGNMLCAGYPQGGKDSCQGDSGGPLVHQVDGQWHQVGIVSFGEGCAQPKFPGVYARVANYNDWVTQQINGTGTSDGGDSGDTGDQNPNDGFPDGDTGGQSIDDDFFPDDGGTGDQSDQNPDNDFFVDDGSTDDQYPDDGFSDNGIESEPGKHYVYPETLNLPDWLDFFSTEGKPEKTTLILKNTTDAEITITSISSDLEAFSISDNKYNIKLAPKKTWEVTVTYTPSNSTSDATSDSMQEEGYSLGNLTIKLSDDKESIIGLYGEDLSALAEHWNADDNQNSDDGFDWFSNDNWNSDENSFSISNEHLNQGDNVALEAQFEGPGTLDFDFGIPNDINANRVAYFVDGQLVRTVSGQRKSTTHHSTQFTKGKHRVTWVYKNQQNTGGIVKINNIKFKKQQAPAVNSLSTKAGAGGSADLFLFSVLTLLIGGFRSGLRRYFTKS